MNVVIGSSTYELSPGNDEPAIHGTKYARGSADRPSRLVDVEFIAEECPSRSARIENSAKNITAIGIHNGEPLVSQSSDVWRIQGERVIRDEDAAALGVGRAIKEISPDIKIERARTALRAFIHDEGIINTRRNRSVCCVARRNIVNLKGIIGDKGRCRASRIDDIEKKIVIPERERSLEYY